MSSKGLGSGSAIDATCMIFCIFLSFPLYLQSWYSTWSLKALDGAAWFLCVLLAEIISRLSRASQYDRLGVDLHLISPSRGPIAGHCLLTLQVWLYFHHFPAE